MKAFKSLAGALPSRVAAQLIKNTAPSIRADNYINFINAYPNWFRAVDRRFLVKTRHGFSIWCDRFDVIGQAIIRHGQWEGLLSRTILAVLKPGDTAIDVGANIGYDTMLMSTAVGTHGRVVTFEPDLENLERLLENIKQLPHSNVLIQSTGVGDETCVAQISPGKSGNAGTANIRPSKEAHTRPLLVGRVDRILPTLDFQRLALVKIDIEGFEHRAILGMGGLLDNVEALTCEIDRGFLQQCGTNPEAIFELMSAHGFTSYCAQPNSDEKWERSGSDYRINVNESQHFDVLFCRHVKPPLESLIKSDA